MVIGEPTGLKLNPKMGRLLRC
uniref:Uncharacterized protein n=1 Tax=Rhizophora mucronata TaxID=61149 RepID=A0A2P2MUU4_RHIMU